MSDILREMFVKRGEEIANLKTQLAEAQKKYDFLRRHGRVLVAYNTKHFNRARKEFTRAESAREALELASSYIEQGDGDYDTVVSAIHDALKATK